MSGWQPGTQVPPSVVSLQKVPVPTWSLHLPSPCTIRSPLCDISKVAEAVPINIALDAVDERIFFDFNGSRGF